MAPPPSLEVPFFFFLHVPYLSPNLPLPFTIAFGVHHIYVTYTKSDAYDMDLENKSLTELYKEIEREIESLFVPDSLPTQVFEALFPGLESPKDKKAARELIREASSSGGLLSQAGRGYRGRKKWV